MLIEHYTNVDHSAHTHRHLNNTTRARAWLEAGGGRCNTYPSNVRPNYISHGALRRAQESVEYRLRLRIQTWQRHHGLLEARRESDERGENVDVGAAGE